MNQSRNLGTFLLIHLLTLLLNSPIFDKLLISDGSAFQLQAPLILKDFIARVSFEFWMIIFPSILSLQRLAARYSGSLDILILYTAKSVWYLTNWLTESQSSKSYIGILLALGGEWVTNCAALFWSTWRSLSSPRSQPPCSGMQYPSTLLNSRALWKSHFVP